MGFELKIQLSPAGDLIFFSVEAELLEFFTPLRESVRTGVKA